MIWAVSIKQAFLTLNVNRKLIGIALISVVFGKIIDLIEQFTDKTLYGLIAASVKIEALQHALESAQTGRFDETFRIFNEVEYLNLEEPQFLIAVTGLLIGAFLIAFYNDTGLAALIRIYSSSTVTGQQRSSHTDGCTSSQPSFSRVRFTWGPGLWLS